MINHNNKPLLRLFPWHYVIATITLYAGVLWSFGINWVTIGVMTIIWYPYLCYYLTYVTFYDKFVSIIHPLFIFWSKKIQYENIMMIRMTAGKGTMMKLYLKGEKKTWTYSPPWSKKKHERMVQIFVSKGLVCE